MKELFTNHDFSSLSGALIGVVQQLQELRLLWPLVTSAAVVISLFSVGQYQISQNAKEIERFRNVVVKQAKLQEQLSNISDDVGEMKNTLKEQNKLLQELLIKRHNYRESP
ncbi:MAG: hypothetical protein D6698_15080 [Gammaproteobacteria bacterium]|nr:MAG: hypothetical protein D6698_15080 [Gammaproteobacteria bacterium]